MNNLGSDLVMPLLHKRISRNTYVFLVDNFEKKFNAWKGRDMSMATQALLIQTFLHSIAS